ncbi:unnamed protein product [Eruca vesicaria subsp. sativa]|uniref:Transcriptional coactivator Hfi1/Transcriptional adapter 1 n=1 Tax=Eruca vesicaria subsp. sativa TaxID=29727 RepID=A0ABC8LV75_ERUVS|nr:unnamed protein product [Eruca vesicaria subsp. sativa]
MQRPEGPRIDLAELKTHIVKKIGVERSRRYFYYLSRFLSQKLTKSEFDKSCHRLLGRENLPLHNKLVQSILRNASLAKSPPPGHKSLVLGKEDGPEQSGSLVPNHNRRDHVWSNGVLPKVRSGTAISDRPSPLGPNGKVESSLHQSLRSSKDKSGNRNTENEDFGPFAYHRSGRYSDERGLRIPDKGQAGAPVSIDDDEAQEQRGRLVPSKGPVTAPLGIPFYAASVGGARRTVPVLNRSDFISCYDSGGLSDAEMLRKRMENIAVGHGLGGVSAECSGMLNNVLDVYLKRLIKSCADLSGSRSRQSRDEIVNVVWPSNSVQIQTSNQPSTQEKHQVSLLDFRVAMELNPSQLGEDWPLLRERMFLRSFEEREGV